MDDANALDLAAHQAAKVLDRPLEEQAAVLAGEPVDADDNLDVHASKSKENRDLRRERSDEC